MPPPPPPYVPPSSNRRPRPVAPPPEHRRFHVPVVDVRVDDGSSARWRWLLLGCVLAACGSFFLPCRFEWFLRAIPHEMGHATVGILFGHPSAPAINLAGHAWAGIGAFRPWLSWTVAIVLVLFAVALRQRPFAAGALGALALALPFVARSDLADVLIAAGGHLGELAFAAFCYALCWSGGYTGEAKERFASAMAGSLVQTGNLRMLWDLIHDPAAQAHYRTSGSLGLKNDYLVLAEELCHCRLEQVAACMLVPAVLALPAGILWGVWRERAGSGHG
jgi:hypothetical protein